VTVEDAELTGWIRWDADEEFSWEILDGEDDRLTFDIELGQVAVIERTVGATVQVSVGARGPDVRGDTREGVRVTLQDGRTFALFGSNDVDEGNDGIFVLDQESGRSPDDPEAVWTMVRWKDFKAVRFEGEGEPPTYPGLGPWRLLVLTPPEGLQWDRSGMPSEPE
jgi:hypothetical protein